MGLTGDVLARDSQCSTGYLEVQDAAASINGRSIYDPTDVFNRNEVSKNINECSIKLGFYLLSFFYYLYCTACAHMPMPPSWPHV